MIKITEQNLVWFERKSKLQSIILKLDKMAVESLKSGKVLSIEYKFNYSLMKNLKTLEHLEKSIQKPFSTLVSEIRAKQGKGYDEDMQKLKEKKLSKEETEKETEKISKKHKEYLDALSEVDTKFNETLAQETELEVYTVHMQSIPEVLSASDLYHIDFFITE